jgi:superfamily II DNA/RNA helicase
VRVLVTNELAARGLDVPECDLIVNLDVPMDSIHYAHRAGRTGRLGRKGTVLTICEEPEVFVVKKLQKLLGVSIPACEFTKGKLVVTEKRRNMRRP